MMMADVINILMRRLGLTRQTKAFYNEVLNSPGLEVVHH